MLLIRATCGGHKTDTSETTRAIIGDTISPANWVLQATKMRRLQNPICRRNRVADDRACTRVTPHGKEGVDGSSPSEGSGLLPAQRPVPLSVGATIGDCDVHRTSKAWTSA